jgi:hypothetical protein
MRPRVALVHYYSEPVARGQAAYTSTLVVSWGHWSLLIPLEGFPYVS